MLKNRHAVTFRSAVIASTVVFAVLFTTSPAALAVSSCTAGTYYNPGQFSINHDFSGIEGYLTNPLASYLPGSSSNHYYHDHMLLVGQIQTGVPSTDDPCVGGNDPIYYCWIQAGVGMGTVTNGVDSAYNGTQSYQAYWENGAPDNGYSVEFDSAIAVDQGVALKFEIEYDGYAVHGLYQYDVHVGDGAGNFYLLGTGSLYYNEGHADAADDVQPLDNATCPTMTNGSPWQNFGTDSDGNVNSGANAVQLQSGGTWTDWGGSPTTQSADPYFYAQSSNWGPAAFRTNGPANGPQSGPT